MAHSVSVIPAGALSAGDVAMLSVLGVLGLALAVATVDVAVRRRAATAEDEPATLSALRAQQVYSQFLYVIAPAVVAGVLSYRREEDIGQAAAVYVAIAAATVICRPDRLPLHLMPVARWAVLLLCPVVGGAVVLAPGLVSTWDIDPNDMVAPVLGAVLIVILARFLESRFEGGSPVRLAVVGPGDLASRLARELAASKIRGYKVVGWLSEEETPLPEPDAITWLGALADTRRVVQERSIDLILIGPHAPRLSAFEETAKACLDLPVRIFEASAFYEQVLGHVPIGAINAAWFQAIMHPRYNPSSPVGKRALDLLVAVPAFVLVALPLMPLLALAVKLYDRGPVFYSQPRVGEAGRVFHIIKFRTMQENAKALAGTVPKEDLITPVGKVLRGTHLDELPQLINVLKGDMTIVGPRPEQPDLVEGLASVVPYYERRALVKPGLTGWAQVRCGYAGTHVGTAWKLCHDLFYVKHRSVVFDILIMLQTFHVLVEATESELATPDQEFILGSSPPPATTSVAQQ